MWQLPILMVVRVLRYHEINISQNSPRPRSRRQWTWRWLPWAKGPTSCPLWSFPPLRKVFFMTTHWVRWWMSTRILWFQRFLIKIGGPQWWAWPCLLSVIISISRPACQACPTCLTWMTWEYRITLSSGAWLAVGWVTSMKSKITLAHWRRGLNQRDLMPSLPKLPHPINRDKVLFLNSQAPITSTPLNRHYLSIHRGRQKFSSLSRLRWPPPNLAWSPYRTFHLRVHHNTTQLISKEARLKLFQNMNPSRRSSLPPSIASTISWWETSRWRLLWGQHRQLRARRDSLRQPPTPMRNRIP